MGQIFTHSPISSTSIHNSHFCPLLCLLHQQFQNLKIKMKSIVFAAILIVSFAAAAMCDTGAMYYAPEYTEYQQPAVVPVDNTGVRGKRHVDPASLAFLVGVGAGGIFGPILYNRLYGWQPVSVGWSEPVVQQGWGRSGGY